VNLAARLQARAQAGETLISDLIKQAVEQLVELESMGEVTLKGLDAPARVWRVIGARSGPATAAAVPLVGRRGEIAMLKSMLDGVAQSRHGAVVYIRGEAGIGKTRLTQVFAEEARARGFSCHVALILDFGAGQGRDALRALIASVLGVAAPRQRMRSPALPQHPMTWSSSMTFSTCRNHRSSARSTMPWTTRRVTVANAGLPPRFWVA
jgi:hypothetical protein